MAFFCPVFRSPGWCTSNAIPPYSFARIFCLPLAGVENFSEVMVLDPRPAVTLPEELTRKAVSREAKPSSRPGQAKKKPPGKD
jgi:rod shape-determining protein MreC